MSVYGGGGVASVHVPGPLTSHRHRAGHSSVKSLPGMSLSQARPGAAVACSMSPKPRCVCLRSTTY